MNEFTKLYQEQLTTAEEAVKAVRSGGTITVTAQGNAENITVESAQGLDIVRA